MKRIELIMLAIIALLSCSCSSSTKKTTNIDKSYINIDSAEYIIEYYKKSLFIINHIANANHIDSIMHYIDTVNAIGALPEFALSPISREDSIFIITPGSPFSQEAKNNLTAGYQNLFANLNAFFENYNTYRLYINEKKYFEDNYTLGNEIRKEELIISISIFEYKSVIYDILTPWVDIANESLKANNKATFH